MIKAEVVADSINPWKNRLTTLLVVMPRYILAEFNTHRMLSKNSASSRAIPFHKMLKTVEEHPFIPMAWQKEHTGMQGFEYYENEDDIEELNRRWLNGRDYAVQTAKLLSTGINDLGVTKGLVNRGLEAYMYHTVLVSGTEWMNFFHQRCPEYCIAWIKPDAKNGEEKDGYDIFKSRKDVIKANPHLKDTYTNNLHWLKMNRAMADIHMQATAEAIWDAMNESTPKQLKVDEWHIPFTDNIELSILEQQELVTYAKSITDLKLKVGTARDARTSYISIESEDLPNSVEQLIKDVKLHDEKLLPSGHWSPFEHSAKVMTEQEMFVICRHQGISYAHSKEDTIEHGMFGNFRGFIQYRKMFANENVRK